MKFLEKASVMSFSASSSCQTVSSSYFKFLQGRQKRAMYVVTKLAKLCTGSALHSSMGIECLLEHGIAIQAQLVLDHSVGNLFRHLLFWELMCRQILGGET